MDGLRASTFSAVFQFWVNYFFNTSITATSYVHGYLILSICWTNKWLLYGTTIIRKCDINHRNVPECVKCCRNTNSEDKLTCVISTYFYPKHFLQSDRDSGTWHGGHGVNEFRKCWHRLQHARKQDVPWCGSPGNPALQDFRMTHTLVYTVFVFISDNTKYDMLVFILCILA